MVGPGVPLRERATLAAALAAGLASLLLHTSTLAPGVTGEDSGELIAAAHSLGIPHPPGYPLWCLLARATAVVFFSADVAWAVNLFSALCAALTVSLVVLVTRVLGGTPLASAMAGAVLAVSRDFWSQAVIAEVYTLNTVFLVALLLAALLYRGGAGSRLLLRFSALLGLALAHHHSIAPFAAVLLLFSVGRFLSEPRRAALAARASALLCAGLLLYLYLPLRSAADPPVDWGDPETLESLVDHISRAQYAGKDELVGRTWGRYAAQVGAALGSAWRQWSPLVLLGAAIGAEVLRRQRRGDAAMLLSLLAVALLGLPAFLNSPLEREELETDPAFFVVAWPVVAVLFGVGLSAVASPLGRFRSAGTAAIGALCIAVSLFTNLDRADRSDDTLVHDYGLGLLESMESEAILFSSSDHTTFPILYFQVVLGRRTDVLLASPYGSVARRLVEGLDGAPESAQEDSIIEREIGRRPIYFTRKRGLPDGLAMVPMGLVYQVVPIVDIHRLRERQEAVWERLSLRGLDTPDRRLDYSGTLVLGDWHFARGRHLLGHGRREEGLAALEECSRRSRGLKQVHNNIGSLLAEQGEFDAAIRAFREAIAIDPAYITARRNLARLLSGTGRTPEAIELWREAAHDGSEPAWRELARLFAGSGRTAEAREAYEAALAQSPRDSDLFVEAGTFALHRLGDRALARRWLEHALRVDNFGRPERSDEVRGMLRAIEAE